jgi:hypothetical protein
MHKVYIGEVYYIYQLEGLMLMTDQVGKQANVTETAIDLTEDTEDIRSRFGDIPYKRKRMWTAGETVDTNDTDGLILDARFFRNKVFHIINGGAQSLIYRVYACLDPDHWRAISSEVTVAAGADDHEFDDGPWAFYKIVVRAASGTTTPIIYAGVM